VASVIACVQFLGDVLEWCDISFAEPVGPSLIWGLGIFLPLRLLILALGICREPVHHITVSEGLEAVKLAKTLQRAGVWHQIATYVGSGVRICI